MRITKLSNLKNITFVCSMGEQTYSFRNPSFNIDRSTYYTLLIQVSKDSFSYAIINDKQLIASGADLKLAELETPTKLADVLTATYKNTVVGLTTEVFTLVPAQLFSKDQIANYAHLLNVKANELVLAQELDKKNFIIYKTDERTIAAVQKFGLNNVVYSGKGWITAAAQNDPSNHNIYLHAENGSAAFLYFKDGDIRFYNSFKYQTEDDLAYYASLVVAELGLNAHDVELKLSSNSTSEEKYNARLVQFFKDIVLFDPQILELPTAVNAQQILTLAALSLCGSSEEF
jgi:hypothetical protein